MLQPVMLNIMFLVVLNWTFLSLTGITVMISFFVFRYINKQQQDFKSKRLIITSLLFVLVHILLSLSGLVNSISLFDPFTPLAIYIIIQVIAIVSGILYYHVVLKSFSKKFHFPILSSMLLCIFIIAFSGVGFCIVFDYFNQREIGWYYCTAFVPFVVPYLFYLTFEAAVQIPVPIFKVWYYPEYPTEIDIDQLDLNRVKVIELEFLKNLNEINTTNFKAKAPEELKFGDWFCMFIQNYNDKYESNPVVYQNGRHEAYGWVFYIKPGFWSSKIFIDPDLTITQSKLTEKMVIVCRRVENN